ncbi:MAG: amino acid permease [Lachnospiraceae bacterium]|nr:amino acid permease [Lachnospiraceae bacterium]
MARYLMPVDVWAIAFGCSIGWGAFVMPGTTFLPIAGPAGTLVAMLLSTALMLVIGYNYAWLMRNRPRKGGVYAYTKEAFGRDHAFLCSWFLSLSYLTVVFLNATALFIISRVLLDDIPQIDFHYQFAGIEIYPGEIALSVAVLVIVGVLLIWHKPLMQIVQRVLAVILLAGALILTLAAFPHFHWGSLLTEFGTGGVAGAAAASAATANAVEAASTTAAAAAGAGTAAVAQAPAAVTAAATAAAHAPAAGGGLQALGSVLTLLLLAPWAFVGFEIASLETPHFDFPIRWSWRVMAAAILSGGFVYTAMTFVTASLRPLQYPSWQAYVADLDSLSGVEGVPTFYAAQFLMGRAGMVLITVTALAAILTGVIGAYRATVRMLSTMAEDKILSREFRGTTFCIVFIMGISSAFTFLGRNTLDWFVELTSFGATVGFAYTSAAAWRIAEKEKNGTVRVTGMLGAVISGIFAVVQLVSQVADVETMCAPSFLLLAVWCLLGFLFYWRTMRQSDLSDFDGVTTSSAVLFCLLFYSVLMWFMKLLTERLASGNTEGLFAYVRRNGLVLMAFTMVGLVVMLYTQSWLRHHHARLERDKMQAEESSKAKTQFLFNMSHDIRTPMNAIIGYTHLASMEADVPPRVRDYIEKIDISGKHLLTLINDVLEMSRIESGKMELMNEPGDIEEALRTAWEMFQEQMEEKKIRYGLEIGDLQDRWVNFDRNRFLRVILNLVSNAWKFTPEGGRVSVSMKQIGASRPVSAYGGILPESSPQWAAYEIRVRDNGIGMTREFAEVVFEAFARERTSTVSRIQGTGLGMAITKSIVEAMQGTIDVVTAPDEGTEFIIRLAFPVCEESERNDGSSAASAGTEKKANSSAASARTEKTGNSSAASAGTEKKESAGRKPDGPETVTPAGAEGQADTREKDRQRRLLVAEDMEINRQLVCMLLENMGYQVDVAENGREALEKIESCPAGTFDAVLMDIQMPVMDGYEAAEKIRGLDDPEKAGIPMIAVTANAFGEDVRKALEKGMDGHISKPIDPGQLSDTLSRILE